MAVRGARLMVEFCQAHGIPHELCGKVVVATTPDEVARLEELERRGRANGVVGLRAIDADELRVLEPHAAGVRGLHVGSTGIVDYGAVVDAYRRVVEERGGELRLGAAVRSIKRTEDGLRLRTRGGTVETRYAINCAGLYADRVAALAGQEPTLRIVPFRGEYYVLRPERRQLVRNLIYPVPDPRFPFLGVHFTRRIDGRVEAGPNAVLALKREGYAWRDVDLREAWATLSYPGFWRLSRRYWRTGGGEVVRSLSRRALVRALQRLLPAVEARDLLRAGAGVRAQALDRDGSLVDDFRIEESERMVHVLNAPSPAATASLCIGATIADRAAAWLGAPGDAASRG
jgi:L-2-hydroxyglutarate oxidase